MRKGSGHSKQEGNEPPTTSSAFLLESHLSGGVGKGVKFSYLGIWLRNHGDKNMLLRLQVRFHSSNIVISLFHYTTSGRNIPDN
jgi:hypothetical protein